MAVKFNSFGKAIAKNDIDTVTLKAMFMATSYTPDADAHVYVSDISSSRASGSTDITLSGLSINVDNTDNRTEFDFSDLSHSTATFTSDGVVIYISTGVDATSELLCYLELQSGGVQTDINVVAGTLTGTVSANGLFSI